MRLVKKILAGILIVTAIVYGGVLVAIMASAEPPSGSEQGLLPCPNSPNCVSSRAAASDSTHYIEPIRFQGPPEETWTVLKSVVSSLPRSTIVAESPGYLHFEVRTFIFRFVDDVEFLLVADEQTIHLRSGARLGHGDLGVNRKRVETLRQTLDQASFRRQR